MLPNNKTTSKKLTGATAISQGLRAINPTTVTTNSANLYSVHFIIVGLASIVKLLKHK